MSKYSLTWDHLGQGVRMNEVYVREVLTPVLAVQEGWWQFDANVAQVYTCIACLQVQGWGQGAWSYAGVDSGTQRVGMEP